MCRQPGNSQRAAFGTKHYTRRHSRPAVNNRIISKDDWADTFLSNNDKVTVIHAVLRRPRFFYP